MLLALGSLPHEPELEVRFWVSALIPSPKTDPEV